MDMIETTFDIAMFLSSGGGCVQVILAPDHDAAQTHGRPTLLGYPIGATPT